MSVRRLGVLQWVGLFGGALAWAGQHAASYGITLARCGAGVTRSGLDERVWQAVLIGVAAALVAVAEASSILVFLQTRGAGFGDQPPQDDRWRSALPFSRLRFFATAAIFANAVFLMIILLDGVASLADRGCRQS